jgi:hypothetical protein
MKIVSLYKNYFQKSQVFLYPALGIKRGYSVTPVRTHMAWKGKYNLEDGMLCCLYHLRSDEDFKAFEKAKLRGNQLFHEFTQLEEKEGVYVFNLAPMIKDWNVILNGKYSKISPEYKQVIRRYMGLNSPHLPYIDSFMYPERYFHLYSELMEMDIDVLKKVGELCSLPDVEKETLIVSVSDLEIVKEKP